MTEAKKKGGCVSKADEITPETINAMVEAAVEKALEPQHEAVTAEQVQEMITAAVAKAVDPVLKSRGLPSNLAAVWKRPQASSTICTAFSNPITRRKTDNG